MFQALIIACNANKLDGGVCLGVFAYRFANYRGDSLIVHVSCYLVLSHNLKVSNCLTALTNLSS